MRSSGEVEEQSYPLACSFLRTQSWVTTRPRQVAVLQEQFMRSRHNELGMGMQLRVRVIKLNAGPNE